MLMQIVAIMRMFISIIIYYLLAYRKLVYSYQNHTGYFALVCCSWPQQLRNVL